MIALSITELAKSFHAGTPGCSATASVLRGVNLALWPGEMVALSGERGSGKSTLLRCAAGLLRPDSGVVRWFGGRATLGERATYVAAGSDHENGARRERHAAYGVLHARLERAQEHGGRVLLVDDLQSVSALERRIVIAMLQRRAEAGAAVLFAANEELSRDASVSRVVTLENGALRQRRKRSAARIAASSRASRARASARSTYGRSLRSPQ
jgi:alpha-D-ribose 1-methylphosphonate 5-triphosphate synthase subunit PhnL